jgi:signal transduction histidine kinase
MDLDVMWSLAGESYSLTAIAAVAVSWCMWHRAPRGRETVLLCSSVASLALHYGCLSIDAFQHATRASTVPFTAWSAFGQVALIVSGALFVTLLVAVVTRLNAPVRPSRWFVRTVVAYVGLASVLALWMGGRLAVTLIVGAPDVVERRVDLIVGIPGGILTMVCFTSPLGFLGGLFEQPPTRGGPRWVRWLTGGWAWQDELPRNQASSTAIDRGTTTHRTRLAFFGFLWLAWVASSPALRFSPVWTPLSLSVSVILHVLLLPSLLALVYYVAPFLFFDVLIKRGLLWSALALLVTIPAFSVVGVLLPSNARPFVGLACVGGTLLVGASATVMERGNRWLDSVLFHRPNYRAELMTISAAMARCPDADTLTTTVTSQVSRALRAAFVRYDTDLAEPSPIVVGLGRPNRPRGYLTLGPRARGQQYGSEDLTFVDAVAAQCAGHLEALEARESAHLAAAAELRALRAQINPHFLFNALTTLAEMAHGEPATERAILNLSRVFRYALESTHQQQVPLGAEIEAIRAYLEIETERFEKQVRFEITVPDDLLAMPVPPMLLQPLVENAVTHGLAVKMSGGTVRIGAVRNNGRLRLTVQDDGVGFDPDRVPRRIGLANVGARVERTGGAWQVQSIPGAGTLITLTLVPS